MGQFKTLIICKSVHHQNTSKVANVLADVLQADLFGPEDVSYEQSEAYDLVGFGSGIYFGRFHSSVRRWVREWPSSPDRRRPAFVFSTSGLPSLWRVWHWPLKAELARKNADVVGEFHCSGFDTVGPLWLLGGLNRRHPDERDLQNAAEFAKVLLRRLSDAE